MKTVSNAGRSSTVSPPDRPFCVEVDFYSMAAILRSQFEKEVMASIELNAGITPFMYVFGRDKYQFLTASAERIFAPDTLEDFTARLHSWASDALGTAHVTTPQARVYIKGCYRNLLRDAISGRWHYIFSLTRNRFRQKVGTVKLLTETLSGLGGGFAIDRIVTSQLNFNHLLVHDTRHAYAIESAQTSMDPLDGAVFLDGYFW